MDLNHLRHSAAHMLAAALVQLYPGTKLGTGPVIDNGFYYDVLPPQPITEADLEKITVAMRKIINGQHEFVREDVTAEQAKKFFADQPFKQELVEKFSKQGEQLHLYHSGPFTDLCQGGHVQNTKELMGVGLKLTKLAGAYWQADAKNAQMTRVYGLLFASKKELNDYLLQLQEAEKRDHRKLGKELGLFTVIDEIGPGFPLFYPKGAALRKAVEDFIEAEQYKLGFRNIWIPHIAKDTLYKTSGHLGKYDAMFSAIKLDNQDYYLKPMNCPHFMMLYKSQPHSYRDLPLRWTATTTVYRNEKSGELAGLTRVRALTQDDCHIFLRPDQIETEINNILDLIQSVYQAFGLNDFWVSISTRDPNDMAKYLGEPVIWDNAEKILEDIISKRHITYKVVPGEAAFYGPKLDFMVKDAIGREWQLSTVQLDFNLPNRFDLHYIAADGSKQRPVVIHRAVLGSVERWLGIMIEHFAGNFPTWMAPVQVKLLAVGEGHFEYAKQIQQQLESNHIRVEVDMASETLGSKIRTAVSEKVSYMVVLGDKEVQGKMVAVRKRGSKDTGTMTLDEFVEVLKIDIREHTSPTLLS
ncbi:MAG: threonine--tRNA ligase [Patescibacteria group bacterium]|jgi:threonyl-tRNA synthetase